jgi:O-succinylbenzoate synthase
MELNDILASVEVIDIPTRINFRNTTFREIALINIDGNWGEFSPFPDYSVERDALWLGSAIEAATTKFPPAKRDRITVNATLPAVSLNQVGEVLSWFPGCRTIKVKIGTTLDIERIDEVLRIIPDARFRLDANGLFSITEAENFLTDLYNRYSELIEYVEQPCASLPENAALKSPLPIAIDENLRLGDDVSEINKVADVVVMKVAPLGGIARSLQIIERLDKPVVISSALESSVGISAGIALAAHLQEEIICGLGTVALLAGDVARQPLLPTEGAVPVTTLEVDSQSLAQYRLSKERINWWHNRIENAFHAYQKLVELSKGGEK